MVSLKFMSYFSDIEYKMKKDRSDLWFERLYYDRWFKGTVGPILDIGCATGNFIAVNPHIIEGIENNEDCYQIAKRRGFNVLKLDIAEAMDQIISGKYEGVYAKHIIEHLADPLAFIRGIERILKPGGRAIILTPNCPYMLNRNFWDDYTHIRPLTKKSLAMLAYDAGFKSFKIYEDFRCFPGLGKMIRFFRINPNQVRQWQSLLGVRGLSLILELTKERELLYEKNQ